MGHIQKTQGILGEEQGQEQLSLYAHLPFCASKCPYCDFASNSGLISQEKRYIDCLDAELQSRAPGLSGTRLASIYFGGGTPSLLKPSSIFSVLTSLRKTFDASGAEITIEANPDSVDIEKLRDFRAFGINRLSLGVQSLSNDELKTMGRRHDSRAAIEAFETTRKAGFDNVGIDLIFGIPGQSIESWKETLKRAVSLRPEHLSIYGLAIEGRTQFADIDSKGLWPSGKRPAGPDEQALMYEMAEDILGTGGWEHYEISNYGIKGTRSVHNAGYWTGRQYLGIGSSAHSYLTRSANSASDASCPWGKRSWNVKDPLEYMALVEGGTSPVEENETLTLKEALFDRVTTGLRLLTDGVDCKALMEWSGLPVEEIFNGELHRLIDEGLMVMEGTRARLTKRGALLSNEVFLSLA